MAKVSSTNAIGVVAVEANDKGLKAQAQDPEAVRKAVIEAVKAIPAASLKKLKNANGRITVLL